MTSTALEFVQFMQELLDQQANLRHQMADIETRLAILETRAALMVTIPDYTPWRWRLQVHPLVN